MSKTLQTEQLPTQIALKKAIDKAGSPTKLAHLIGVKSAQVFVMMNRDKKASTKYVRIISEKTGVPLHELRPDLYSATNK